MRPPYAKLGVKSPKPPKITKLTWLSPNLDCVGGGDGDGGVELQAPTRLFPLPLAAYITSKNCCSYICTLIPP